MIFVVNLNEMYPVSQSYIHTCVNSSYGTGRGLERPGGAADAVAVVSMVGGQAGRAGGEGGGHRQGTAWGGRLGRTLLGAAGAVVVAVAILELDKTGKEHRVELDQHIDHCYGPSPA